MPTLHLCPERRWLAWEMKRNSNGIEQMYHNLQMPTQECLSRVWSSYIPLSSWSPSLPISFSLSCILNLSTSTFSYQINMLQALLWKTSPLSFSRNPSHSFGYLPAKFLDVIMLSICILSNDYSTPPFRVTNLHFDKAWSLESDAWLECQACTSPVKFK